MTKHADLLPIAMEAVDKAANIVRNRDPGQVTTKGDRDMATEVDFAVERTIRTFLAEQTPNIAFLGEEEGATGGNAGLTWALDPVDGTVNFIHGHPLVGISLALIDHGRPVLGIIDAPFLQTRCWATSGAGAYQDGATITVSATKDMRDAVIAIGDYAVGPDAAAINEARFALTRRVASTAQRVRMHGSAAIDFAWLASGSVDALVILVNNVWDVAAGVVIAREAGAVVVDADGSEHRQDSTATIAVTPGLRDELLGLINSEN